MNHATQWLPHVQTQWVTHKHDLLPPVFLQEIQPIKPAKKYFKVTTISRANANFSRCWRVFNYTWVVCMRMAAICTWGKLDQVSCTWGNWIHHLWRDTWRNRRGDMRHRTPNFPGRCCIFRRAFGRRRWWHWGGALPLPPHSAGSVKIRRQLRGKVLWIYAPSFVQNRGGGGMGSSKCVIPGATYI